MLNQGWTSRGVQGGKGNTGRDVQESQSWASSGMQGRTGRNWHGCLENDRKEEK